MLIEPKVRGFICTTAHPSGCFQQVMQQIEFIKQKKPLANGPKKVLIIGASTGYGLASRIAAAFGSQAKTIGVFFEKAASGKRTASAGWYNSAAFEAAARNAGLYAKSINGDAFSDDIKQQTIDLINQDLDGEVDLVIYSLAAPKRVDPQTGEVFSSVLKPVGSIYQDKTVNVMSGEVSEVEIEPATEEEITNTEKVMGGEDWQRWIDQLTAANVLATGATTVAYSYIGPEMTYPIYRNGTIGRAKEDLEKTAQRLDKQLATRCKGRAFISVNKALVTQASAAIPVVPLYVALLYKVMKQQGNHEGCIEQIWRLYQDRLYRSDSVPVDAQNRIRLDDWEMQANVQQAVSELWQQVDSDNLVEISDIAGYRTEFYQLFGFETAGVNYQAEIKPEVSIPSLEAVEAN